MVGHIGCDLRRTILDNDVGCLSPEEVERIRKDDEMALQSLDLKISWDIIDSERNARQKMMLFLG